MPPAEYRRLPMTVLADQFTDPTKPPKGVFWEMIPEETRQSFRFYVVTIHGQKTFIELGDWILPEPDGLHWYPCKPDVFKSTYERIENGL